MCHGIILMYGLGNDNHHTVRCMDTRSNKYNNTNRLNTKHQGEVDPAKNHELIHSHNNDSIIL